MADESTIRAILVAHAGTTALISTRLYDEVVPTNVASPVARPFVVMTASEVPFNHVTTEPAAASFRIQFDIYADTKAGCKAVLAQIRAALAAAGYANGEEIARALPADDPALRRISTDWLVVLNR